MGEAGAQVTASMGELIARVKARNRAVTSAVLMAVEACGHYVGPSQLGRVVVHRAVSGGCEWRVTFLGEWDDEPIGHVDARDLQAAAMLVAQVSTRVDT